MDWKKIILGTGLVAGVGAATAYAFGLLRTSANLEVMTKAMIYSMKLSAVTIRVDVTLKNPTKAGFKIRFPFVKLVYQGTTVGSSQVIDKEITVPPFGQVTISQIMIAIPVLSLLTTAGKLLKELNEKKSALLSVHTITTINLGWKTLPYQKEDKLTLNLPQAA
jgi:hypothetical protein